MYPTSPQHWTISTPQKINFQSVLRNSVGEVLSNKSVSIRISILSGSTTGTNVYSETHSKTTDASGLLSIQIGEWNSSFRSI